MKYQRNGMGKLKNINIILLTSLLYACGGGGNESTSPKTPKEPISTVTNTCAKTQLNNDSSCIKINNRDSILYQPANQINDGIALFLHGSPGNASKVMNIFSAKEIAAQYNLIALAPEGETATWGWESVNEPGNDNVDVDYITELLTKVRGDYNVSSNKLYVFGYSAGGFMAYKLACNIPEKISGIISLSGQFRGDFSACDTSTPVRIHHFHSPSDQEVPYLGRAFGNIKGVDSTIEHWRNKNGCDVSKTNTSQGGVTTSSPSTESISYQNCVKEVTLSKMLDVPHEASYQSNILLEIYAPIFTP